MVTGVRRAVPQDLPVVVEVESSYYYSISSYFTYSFFVGRGTGHRDGEPSVNTGKTGKTGKAGKGGGEMVKDRTRDRHWRTGAFAEGGFTLLEKN